MKKFLKKLKTSLDLLIKYFCLNKNIKNIIVLRNSKLPQTKNKKIIYHLTSPKKKLEIILNSIKTKN